MTVQPRHVHLVQSLETLQGGGLGAAALTLHLALRALGHTSDLLTTRAALATGDPAAEHFVRQGLSRAFYAPGLAARARALASPAPVVFHQHGFYAYPSAVCGRTARRFGRPLVCHPQGMLDPWILRRSRAKKKLAHWLYENASFRHAFLWRALTAKEADQIRAQGIRAPIVVWPNGIDAQYFQPGPPPPREPAERTLLFLGRLHPKKGIDLLLEAWSRLGPLRRGWRLCLAGPDERGYLAQVQARIAATRLGDAITLPGPLHGAAKLAALQAADAFVLCSYSEGLPVSVLEALACGLPVVISDECNLPEVAIEECGWVCRPEPAALTEALRQLLRGTAQERRQRGAIGRALVERKFDSRIIADGLHAAAAELCP